MELEYKGKFNFSYQKFDENNLSILKKSLLDDFVEMLQLDLDNFQNQLIDDGVLSSDENMLENSKIKFYPIVGESDFTLQEFLKDIYKVLNPNNSASIHFGDLPGLVFKYNKSKGVKHIHIYFSLPLRKIHFLFTIDFPEVYFLFDTNIFWQLNHPFNVIQKVKNTKQKFNLYQNFEAVLSKIRDVYGENLKVVIKNCEKKHSNIKSNNTGMKDHPEEHKNKDDGLYQNNKYCSVSDNDCMLKKDECREKIFENKNRNYLFYSDMKQRFFSKPQGFTPEFLMLDDLLYVFQEFFSPTPEQKEKLSLKNLAKNGE